MACLVHHTGGRMSNITLERWIEFDGPKTVYIAVTAATSSSTDHGRTHWRIVWNSRYLCQCEGSNMLFSGWRVLEYVDQGPRKSGTRFGFYDDWAEEIRAIVDKWTKYPLGELNKASRHALAMLCANQIPVPTNEPAESPCVESLKDAIRKLYAELTTRNPQQNARLIHAGRDSGNEKDFFDRCTVEAAFALIHLQNEPAHNPVHGAG